MANFTNVINFSKESKDLWEAIKSYASDYIKERRYNFSGVDDEVKKKLINKEFLSELSRRSGMDLMNTENMDRVAIKRLSSNPSVIYFANEIRDDMIDTILPMVMDNSGIKAFADVKYADLGDTIKFDMKSNGLFHVSTAGERKRHGELQKSYNGTETMVGVNHTVTVGTTLYEVLTGESYIAEELVKVAISIENQMLVDVYNAFATEVANLPASPNTTPLKATGSVSEVQALEIAQRVQAYNEGVKPVFVGTSVALKKLIPNTAGGKYEFESDFVKVGYLRVFNDYGVIPLDQVANPSANSSTSGYNVLLPNNQIYILTPTTDKIVKLGVFGGTYTEQDNRPNANNSMLTTTNKHWEAKVCTNSICGLLSYS